MIRELSKDKYDLIVNLGLLITPDFSTDKISDNEKIIIYEEDNVIMGFLQYSKLYETIDIINISVLESYRRKSIGTKLVDYISTLDDIKHIMLEVRTSNINAIKFYEKLGFKTVRIIKNYYDKEDALSMEKVIKWKTSIF